MNTSQLQDNDSAREIYYRTENFLELITPCVRTIIVRGSRDRDTPPDLAWMVVAARVTLHYFQSERTGFRFLAYNTFKEIWNQLITYLTLDLITRDLNIYTA